MISPPSQPLAPLPSALPSAQTTAQPLTAPQLSHPSNPHDPTSKPKAPKLTKAQRKAASANRRPNPHNPARDYRPVKYSTAEANKRRYDERYARLKSQGGGKVEELLERRRRLEGWIATKREEMTVEEESTGCDEGGGIKLRGVSSANSLVKVGGLQGRIRDMVDRAWKEWLDGMDEEDEKNGIAPPSAQINEVRGTEEGVASRTGGGKSVYMGPGSQYFVTQTAPQSIEPRLTPFQDAYNQYIRDREASKAALDKYLLELPRKMLKEGRSRSAVQEAVDEAESRWHKEWPYLFPDAGSEGGMKWLGERKRGVEKQKVETRVELQKEVMRRAGKGEEEIRDMEEREWWRWEREFPDFTNEREMREWEGRMGGVEGKRGKGGETREEKGKRLAGDWEYAYNRYITYREAEKAMLARTLQVQRPEPVDAQRIHDYLPMKEAWANWSKAWPIVGAEVPLEWVFKRNMEVEMGRVRRRVEAQTTVMRAAGKGGEEIRGMEEKAWERWREEFPGDAWLVEQQANHTNTFAGQLPLLATLHQHLSWKLLEGRYHRHREKAKAKLEKEIVGKKGGERLTPEAKMVMWDHFNDEWGNEGMGMWEWSLTGRDQYTWVFERCRDLDKEAIEKQVKLREQVMRTAGKTEGEVGAMKEGVWQKWRKEYGVVKKDEDGGDGYESDDTVDGLGETVGMGSGGDVNESEGEELAETFDELEVGELEISDETEVDESVYDTDTEGGVDLRAWESDYE